MSSIKIKVFEIIDAKREIAAKKLPDISKLTAINTGNQGGQYKVGEVIFDNKNGLGATPNNAEIDYFGFTVIMKIDTFLKLAAPHNNARGESVNDIMQLMKEGYGIGAPMLYLTIEDFSSDIISAKVNAHEGRARALCCQHYFNLTEFPVHIMPTGYRAKHFTKKKIDQLNKNGIRNEQDTKLIQHPFEKVII